jgi:hypothetical protein
MTVETSTDTVFANEDRSGGFEEDLAGIGR